LIKKYLTYFGVIATMVFIFSKGYTQKTLESNFNVGVKIGGSKLMGEIPYDFSEVIKEFDNKFGFNTALEISKYIYLRWEIGVEIGYSTLNGNTDTPEFSAEGVNPFFPSEITESVEYKTILFAPNFFFRYFFKPASGESAFKPFIHAGGGLLNYNSKFNYINATDNELLFGKGTKGYTKLSTPVFFIGTGFKTSLTSQFYMITSIDFNMVNYDFLDVMHNYGKEGTRIDIIGLYSEFKIGFFYNFSESRRDKTKLFKYKNESSSKDNHLPFSR
jgi:hypothetical protein